jgi:hypothetical protein
MFLRVRHWARVLKHILRAIFFSIRYPFKLLLFFPPEFSPVRFPDQHFYEFFGSASGTYQICIPICLPG